MSYLLLGEVKQKQTKASFVGSFKAKMQEGRQIVSSLESAIWNKYQDAYSCDLRAKIVIAASSNKDTYTGYKLKALNLLLDGSCAGKLEQARDLYKAFDQLESIATSPGYGPGDPPNTPLIFVRPQDVLSTVEKIINATTEQVKILSKWVDRSDIEINVEAFKSGLASVLASGAEVAGDVIGETASNAFKSASDNIKKGKFPWTIAFAGIAVIGTGIWVGGKFK